MGEPERNILTDTGIEVEVELITPELAQWLLDHNNVNRPISRETALRYAMDIKAGDWRLTGETIIIATDGELLNGQHRLKGVVEAGTPMVSVVVRGVERRAIIAMDSGKKRSLGDVLSWLGEKNVFNLASAISMGWRWTNATMMVKRTTPTNDQCLDWLEQNPSIRVAVNEARKFNLTPFRIPISAGAPFIHRLKLIDPSASAEFLHSVYKGAGLKDGDGSLLLRNWVLREAAKYGPGQKPENIYYLAIMIKAWNLWIAGEGREVLVWRRGSRAAERFPLLINANGEEVELLPETTMRANGLIGGDQPLMFDDPVVAELASS
jgi:hypothetical protein